MSVMVSIQNDGIVIWSMRHRRCSSRWMNLYFHFNPRDDILTTSCRGIEFSYEIPSCVGRSAFLIFISRRAIRPRDPDKLFVQHERVHNDPRITDYEIRGRKFFRRFAAKTIAYENTFNMYFFFICIVTVISLPLLFMRIPLIIVRIPKCRYIVISRRENQQFYIYPHDQCMCNEIDG